MARAGMARFRRECREFAVPFTSSKKEAAIKEFDKRRKAEKEGNSGFEWLFSALLGPSAFLRFFYFLSGG
jgi:hypothetical protein